MTWQWRHVTQWRNVMQRRRKIMAQRRRNMMQQRRNMLRQRINMQSWSIGHHWLMLLFYQILSLQRFASRQDQTNPETWLGSRCPCPTCRLIFVGHSSMKFDLGSALVDKYKSESCFTFSNPLPLSETQFTPLFCSINHILKVLKWLNVCDSSRVLSDIFSDTKVSSQSVDFQSSEHSQIQQHSRK